MQPFGVGRRPAVRVVLLVAVSLGLLYAAFIVIFDPTIDTRDLTMGACLIAAAAAVSFNAWALGAMTPVARDPEQAAFRLRHNR